MGQNDRINRTHTHNTHAHSYARMYIRTHEFNETIHKSKICLQKLRKLALFACLTKDKETGVNN